MPPERVPRNVDVRVFSHTIVSPAGETIFVSVDRFGLPISQT